MKINDYHMNFNIFGMKIKLINLKKFVKYIKYIMQFEFDRKFIYTCMDKMSNRDKILYLSNRFYKLAGYYPNLKYPKTFNEKINWMKLNYYNPIENIAIDKYEFKQYIKEKLGEGYTIPYIGVYEDVNDIDFEKLPKKFVVKTTEGGCAEGVFIVKDKSKLNIDKLKYELSYYQQGCYNSYCASFLRGHKEIKSRILVEEYIEQPDGKLYDYKFHCFHGEPKLVLGIPERKNGRHKVSFMTPEWKKIDLHRGNKRMSTTMEKPKNYDKMLEISKILSKDFPFVRVDMYDLGDRVYVGELTFTPCGGFGVYEPMEWDYKLGEWLDLDKLPKKYLNIMPELETTKHYL